MIEPANRESLAAAREASDAKNETRVRRGRTKKVFTEVELRDMRARQQARRVQIEQAVDSLRVSLLAALSGASVAKQILIDQACVCYYAQLVAQTKVMRLGSSAGKKDWAEWQRRSNEVAKRLAWLGLKDLPMPGAQGLNEAARER